MIEGLEEFITPVDKLISEKLLSVLFGTDLVFHSQRAQGFTGSESIGGRTSNVWFVL